jgi:hypothetical protein
MRSAPFSIMGRLSFQPVTGRDIEQRARKTGHGQDNEDNIEHSIFLLPGALLGAPPVDEAKSRRALRGVQHALGLRDEVVLVGEVATIFDAGEKA